MNELLFGFLGTLLGVGVTVFVTYLNNKGHNKRLKLQLDHDRSLKKDERYIAHVEEVYLLLEEWLIALVNCYAPIAKVTTGELLYEQAIKKAPDFFNKSQLSKTRLEMLIDLYFPEAKEDFYLCLEKREEIIKIVNDFFKEYKGGNTDGERFTLPLQAAIVGLNEHGDRVKGIIIDLTKKV